MKATSLAQIKKELKNLSPDELYEICAYLGRFKVENKLLLTYLLYYSNDEHSYIEDIKDELEKQFLSLNTQSYFYMKKTIRKVLRQIKLYSRISRSLVVEIELLLFFCKKLITIEPSITKNKTLNNLYQRQLDSIVKKVDLLHEDLQYDYKLMLEAINH